VKLFLVTDRRRLAGDVPLETARRCLLRQVEAAVEARLDCVIVRERDLEARDLTDLITSIVAMTRDTSTRVVVNDRVDVALASGADGVHLRGDSIAPGIVRRMTPKDFLIGRSVHSAQEAASVAGADYLIAGTVWPSASKQADQQLLGVDGFSSVVRAARVPVLAIGGVTIDRIGEIAKAGGAGIAAIALFMGDARDECRVVQLNAIATEARMRFDTSRSGS
jgi:thiamine-phosphate diphosphorylase